MNKKKSISKAQTMGCHHLQPFTACAGLVAAVGVVMMGGDGVALAVESQGKEGGSGGIMS